MFVSVLPTRLVVYEICMKVKTEHFGIFKSINIHLKYDYSYSYKSDMNNSNICRTSCCRNDKYLNTRERGEKLVNETG